MAAAAGPVFTTPGGSHSRGPAGVTYPTAVTGTYVPLPMACSTERRVLWYAPGTAADSMWRDLEMRRDGPVGFESTALSVSGNYQPITGDFDGDGCEDVLWYAPGAAADFVWYFGADGAHTSVPVTLNGSYTPIVGDFNGGDEFDDIFWYAPGAVTDSIWVGTEVRGGFIPSAAKQVVGTYQPVLAVDDSTILWYRPGAGADRLWRGVMAGTATVDQDSPTTVNGTYSPRNLGGTALLYAPGSAPDQSIRGSSSPSGDAPVTLQTQRGDIDGPYVVSSSTYRAGFGVLHAPGPAPDLLIDARTTGTLRRQPDGANGQEGDDHSGGAAITPDGRTVVVNSTANNLVPGSGGPNQEVYLWDLTSDTFLPQPDGVDGARPNGQTFATGVSDDASVVLLASSATNLVSGPRLQRWALYVWHVLDGTYQRQPMDLDGTIPEDELFGTGRMSADATVVVFDSWSDRWVVGDQNDAQDVFVWDLTTGTYDRQPLALGGMEPDNVSWWTWISGDGTKVGLASASDQLVAGDGPAVDIYIWDRDAGTYLRQPDGYDGQAPNASTRTGVLDEDGSTFVLSSDASNLVPGDTNAAQDTFVWDVNGGTYRRQPNGIDGKEPDGHSSVMGVSDDGNVVLLETQASNLVDADTNEREDLVVWDLVSDTYQPVPVGHTGIAADSRVGASDLSADGSTVVLTTAATNLLPGDTNGKNDTYLWYRTSG